MKAKISQLFARVQRAANLGVGVHVTVQSEPGGQYGRLDIISELGDIRVFVDGSPFEIINKDADHYTLRSTQSVSLFTTSREFISGDLIFYPTEVRVEDKFEFFTANRLARRSLVKR